MNDPMAKQMVTLAFASYAGFLSTSPAAIQRKVEVALAALQDLVGERELHWGPAMQRGSLARVRGLALFDEAMMMVLGQPADPDELTVVIRGTNPVSLSSWVLQDFDVKEQVPWFAPGAPVGAVISHGVQRTLDKLTRELEPAEGLPGAGSLLWEFLKPWLEARRSRSARITVTGHSLGGVAAPTLALWLREHLPLSVNHELCVYAFAGPTAGNAAFADYTQRTFRARLRRFENPLDVVPAAWNLQAIEEVTQKYERCFDAVVVKALRAWALHQAATGDYTQPQPGTSTSEKWLDGVNELWAQAAYQHTVPYLGAFDQPQRKRILDAMDAHRLLEGAGHKNHRQLHEAWLTAEPQ